MSRVVSLREAEQYQIMENNTTNETKKDTKGLSQNDFSPYETSLNNIAIADSTYYVKTISKGFTASGGIAIKTPENMESVLGKKPAPDCIRNLWEL